MALTVKAPTMKEELALFEKLLDDPYYSSLKGLLESGEVKAQFAFYNISLSWGNGQVIAANMPLSVPNLQSIAAGDPKLSASRKIMLGLYKELTIEMGHSSLVAVGSDVEVAPAIVPPEEKEKILAKMKAAQKKQDDFASEDLGPPKKKPVKPVAPPAELKSATKMPFIGTGVAVPLRTAIQLGQLVNGTSPGSKYYMVASNERIKVAIRKQTKANTLSIRVEGLPNHSDQVAMIQAGMSKTGVGSQSYWSMHVHLVATVDDMEVNIPAGRVVGAFLMGLGIQFDQAIINVDEIPEG